LLRRIVRLGFRCIAGILAVVFLLVWDVCGWAPIPTIRGTISARIDVKHGRYKQLGYGLPVPWRAGYEILLRKRYGVEAEVIAGCVVTRYLKDYVAAYNEVSEGAANIRYEHDVFKEVSDEAMSDWKREHVPKPAHGSALRN
jgi:hypothetical protein